jgi:hypothetical protein
MGPVRQDTPVLPARTGATASGTSELVTEEVVVFAVLAETLRGTLPK